MINQPKFLLLLFVICLNLSVYSQQPNPEIFLFSVEKNADKFTFSGGKNITNNAGYDNQPSFSIDNRTILFTSNRNGKDTNIYEYFLADGKTEQLTASEDNEYTAKDFDGVSFAGTSTLDENNSGRFYERNLSCLWMDKNTRQSWAEIRRKAHQTTDLRSIA